MVPEDVKKAAVLLGEWCRYRVRGMREAGAQRPRVMLFVLVADVCEYFLREVEC